MGEKCGAAQARGNHGWKESQHREGQNQETGKEKQFSCHSLSSWTNTPAFSLSHFELVSLTCIWKRTNVESSQVSSSSRLNSFFLSNILCVVWCLGPLTSSWYIPEYMCSKCRALLFCRKLGESQFDLEAKIFHNHLLSCWIEHLALLLHS